MGERENIKNCDGNIEALRREENRIASGEEQLEAIQEELYEELDDLIEDFKARIAFAAKHSEYDLLEDAETYVKDQLW